MWMKCARVLISGRVQGVFFRASAREEAQRLSLSGWVRNLPDGRVEALLAGPQDKVNAMIAWCHQGPPSANVTGVEVSWEEAPPGLKGFRVR
ncbi:MAG: acylphosphatase [Bacillota bacterium]